MIVSGCSSRRLVVAASWLRPRVRWWSYARISLCTVSGWCLSSLTDANTNPNPKPQPEAQPWLKSWRGPQMGWKPITDPLQIFHPISSHLLPHPCFTHLLTTPITIPNTPCSISPLVLQYTFFFVHLLTLVVPFCNIWHLTLLRCITLLYFAI